MAATFSATCLKKVWQMLASGYRHPLTPAHIKEVNTHDERALYGPFPRLCSAARLHCRTCYAACRHFPRRDL